MIDLCEGCKHKDDICFMIEWPCLDYEPKDSDEQKEGKNE